MISKRPDEKFGEIVVLLTEGFIDDAQAICERILPKYHQPRAYLHVPTIPLTATGKPARKQAEELAFIGLALPVEVEGFVNLFFGSSLVDADVSDSP